MRESKDESAAVRRPTVAEPGEAWRQDRDFVARVLAGDEVACEEFATRTATLPYFLRTKSAELGCGLSSDELSDLTQDALVVVWRRLDTFLGHSALETWACAIGYHQLMNYLRRKQRRMAREGGLEGIEVPATDDTTLAHVDPDALNHALAAISSDDAELLRLKHEEGLSFPALAERLGVTTPKVKHRYYGVLDRLRSRLKSGQGEAS